MEKKNYINPLFEVVEMSFKDMIMVSSVASVTKNEDALNIFDYDEVF